MTITKKPERKKLTVTMEGRLDTDSTPQAEKELMVSLDTVKELILDFSKLDYISSAGLRLLLMMKKKMDAQGGSMKILNANAMVREIFDVTGFSDLLTIE